MITDNSNANNNAAARTTRALLWLLVTLRTVGGEAGFAEAYAPAAVPTASSSYAKAAACFASSKSIAGRRTAGTRTRPKTTIRTGRRPSQQQSLLRSSNRDEGGESSSSDGSSSSFLSSGGPDNAGDPTKPPTDARFGDVVKLPTKPPTEARFGDVVKLPTKPPTEARFGDVVELPRRSSPSPGGSNPFIADGISSTTTTTTPIATTTQDTDGDIDETRELLKQRRQRNVAVALLSVALGLGNYGWQWTHPATPIQLMVQMEKSSCSVTDIGKNSKPSVIDFWAPWCTECRRMAPTAYRIDEMYKGRVNFVSVNGDDPKNWPLIEKLGVDAIPHVSLVESDGTVSTALIGPVPEDWLRSDIDVLLENADNAANANEEGTTTAEAAPTATKRKPLPYQMLDAFANQPPEQRKVSFEEVTPK